MSDGTGIEWTDATWNPIVGCSVVSPGCTNCYAMRMAARIEKMAVAKLEAWQSDVGATISRPSPFLYAGLTLPSKAGAVWTGKVARAADETLTAPLRWKKPRKVFVNSMGDLFHEAVPDAWIDRVFAVMALAPQHTFQVLTKRSGRMRAYVSSRAVLDESGQPAEDVRCAMTTLAATPSRREMAPTLKAIPLGKICAGGPWPLPNVWLGVSAEDQRRADERVPDLLATPAAVRFVSAEPLLGPIDFTNINPPDNGYGGRAHGVDALSKHNRVLRGVLDWVIAGGESGLNARPLHVAWARSIVDQCKAAEVACFVKQLGGRPTMNERDAVQAVALGAGWDRHGDKSEEGTVFLRHRKGAAPIEWPADLRVQEWPR